MALRVPVFHDATGRFTDEINSTSDEIAVGKISLAGISGIALDGGNARAVNFGDPVGSQDLVTKAYADALANNLDTKLSVRAATTANITLSGTQTIDGVALLPSDRVLVKNQSTASENGIYVAAAGAWSRSSDADVSAEVTSGLYTFVSEGTTQGSTGWTLITVDPIILGTTGLVFTQFNGAGTYMGGAGLTLTGNVFAVGDGPGILVNADSIEVELATDPALEFDAGGAGGKLRFKPDTSRGMNRDASGAYVAISATPGLEFSSGLLQAKVDPDGGIERVTAGLKAKLDGTTLQSVTAGLSVKGLPLLFEVNGVATVSSVTAANFNTLTNGSNADALHSHAAAAATEVIETYTALGAINKGQGVYISGSGQVSAGDCDSDPSAFIIGVANQTVSNGASVQVTRIGLVTGVLSGATAGAQYWLGASGSPVLIGALPNPARTILMGYAKNSTDLEVQIFDHGKKRN